MFVIFHLGNNDNPNGHSPVAGILVPYMCMVVSYHVDSNF